ncbi:hypothetical protein RO3G_12124 [Rhizopus delemar RA 99-880]|uniref:Uncharacterized protein n=1 Tax=Rhizopus delemar (strain RA 99-880 / ATCC MYA-4621 / FGSC 9543 / NRRL 43880) TaxID=246409 RepID=I1CG33_RHIO9|nr:hypothetical protein RO3G_12124 [Rhizopus delemar RA 99-880]|eukprot:EIE87413.1 hypothetical protein RO3G_12124 [Rhizopus delemar RA 99-880]
MDLRFFASKARCEVWSPVSTELSHSTETLSLGTLSVGAKTSQSVLSIWSFKPIHNLRQVGIDISQQTTMANLDRAVGDLNGVYHVNNAVRDWQARCFHQGGSKPDLLSSAVDQARFVCHQGADGM